MAEEQMAGHKKIGSISGTAPTQGELEKKFAMAAAQWGPDITLSPASLITTMPLVTLISTNN